MAFTVLLSVLAAGCGIKYATNKVLSNPEAIAKVGAVYDRLNPRDTTERLVFIPGDSIVVEKTDTIYAKRLSKFDNSITIQEWLKLNPDSSLNNFAYLGEVSNDWGAIYKDGPAKNFLTNKIDTIRINTIRTIRRTDTIIKTLPPDNRAMARLLDSLGKYTNELNQAKGSIKEKDKGLKTAENRLIWMAGVLLLAGVVIGVLIRLKLKP